MTTCRCIVGVVIVTSTAGLLGCDSVRSRVAGEEGECCGRFFDPLGAWNPDTCRTGLVCEAEDSVCSEDGFYSAGTCRRTCERDSDCPDGCQCLDGRYAWTPGDENPKTCRGGWACGGYVESCTFGLQECDQRLGPRTCINLNICYPPGPMGEWQPCSPEARCGMGLGCADRVCRRTCATGNPCPDGSACGWSYCFPACEHWGTACEPLPSGVTTSCRPLGDGGAVCIADDGTGEGSSCSYSFCAAGLVCLRWHNPRSDRYSGQCRRFCSEEYQSCGEQACILEAELPVCVCPPGDGGYAMHCECPPPGYDAGPVQCWHRPDAGMPK
jgi:hypothetical protein